MSNITQLKVQPKSDEITYSVKQIAIDRIRAFDFQPRKWFDPEELSARAMSMKTVGQQVPVTVEALSGDPDHDYELIDGESRYRSAKEAGIKTLWAAVRSVPFGSKVEKHMASLVANFNRSEHAPMEISDALLVQTTQGGMTQDQVAKALGRSHPWVSSYLKLQDLHPELQALMHPSVPKQRRLSIATAIEIARLAIDKQEKLFKSLRDQDGTVVLTRRKVRNAIRKRTDDPQQWAAEVVHWTPEREARRQALHTPNSAHVAKLAAGIAEFRALLNR